MGLVYRESRSLLDFDRFVLDVSGRRAGKLDNLDLKPGPVIAGRDVEQQQVVKSAVGIGETLHDARP
jgi:hypothetical protein